MDVSVVGRGRIEEQAILEELGGPAKPVRISDRRWMLAIAGIAAIVCMGFAGDLVSPAPADTTLIPDRAAPAPSAPTAPSATASSPAEAIVVDLSRPDGAVVDGLVPVLVRTVPDQRVHLSVSVGAAVIGWRDVKADADGNWAGTVAVFAPRVALPATVRAATSVGILAVEGTHPVVLGGGQPIVVWDASVTRGRTGSLTVAYRASAPLTFTEVDAWVTGKGGARIGAASSASSVDEWRPGSAGASGLGLGSVTGAVPISQRDAGRLVLHLRWHDASTGASGVVERVLRPTQQRPQGGRSSRRL